MKNKLMIVCIFGLMICFSCKEQVSESMIIKQKVFENLASCCKLDTCNTPVTLRNQTGKLVSHTLDLSGKRTYFNIEADITPSISNDVLPLWSYYGGEYDICNMPEQLVYSTKEQKIKFDCKIFYMPYKKNPDGTVPQRGGYPTQLLRIEVLD